MKKLMFFLGALYCLCFLPVALAGEIIESCTDSIAKENVQVKSKLCVFGKNYYLRFVRNGGKILLRLDGKEINIEKISNKYDPTLVGADALIGFLPENFQRYLNRKIIAYVSSMRSTGGDGTGQCGAGAEIYLNFLDIGHPVPKVKSRILIGSCKQSIELADQNIGEGKLGEISSGPKGFVLHFMNYKSMDGSPSATVMLDGKQLVFEPAK